VNGFFAVELIFPDNFTTMRYMIPFGQGVVFLYTQNTFRSQAVSSKRRRDEPYEVPFHRNYRSMLKKIGRNLYFTIL